MHAANVDGLGYAFPYDDVSADGGEFFKSPVAAKEWVLTLLSLSGNPQEGAIFSFSPTKLTVIVGGKNASA